MCAYNTVYYHYVLSITARVERCVCVCVCVRERERERESRVSEKERERNDESATER